MWRLLLTLLVLTVPANAEEVVAGLSQNRVAITANFDGSEILIFGAIKGEAPEPESSPVDVLITVEGPSEPVVVRRKEKRFGIWVNTDAVDVSEAPSFYKVAASGSFSEVLTQAEDAKHKISIEHAIGAPDTHGQVEDARRFTEALIRIRKRDHSFQEQPHTVIVFEHTLFRHNVALPANLTEGNYKVRIFLTRDGAVVDVHESQIFVRKVGLERFLFNLAQHQPLIYGLLSLAIAIAAGWLASAVFVYARR